ncbi:hypothetical protein MSAN_02488000 [Mycena sanguinolenta]|uniref:Uncharacterized protein n=1 Tax=Mycena sanguinolenta TaxID=230812 RepID=A0A8H6U3P1_9AGAR|nr:hypothetical protein MSAN_02488000 [Mycena sanguinolenta]
MHSVLLASSLPFFLRTELNSLLSLLLAFPLRRLHYPPMTSRLGLVQRRFPATAALVYSTVALTLSVAGPSLPLRLVAGAARYALRQVVCDSRPPSMPHPAITAKYLSFATSFSRTTRTWTSALIKTKVKFKYTPASKSLLIFAAPLACPHTNRKPSDPIKIRDIASASVHVLAASPLDLIRVLRQSSRIASFDLAPPASPPPLRSHHVPHISLHLETTKRSAVVQYVPRFIKH